MPAARVFGRSTSGAKPKIGSLQALARKLRFEDMAREERRLRTCDCWLIKLLLQDADRWN